MRWPFSKKAPETITMVDGPELAAARLANKMRETYPIGCMFPYLGRRCLVVAHREFAEFVPLVNSRRNPRMVVHYADDNGCIVELTFEGDLLRFMLRPEVVAQKFMTIEEHRRRAKGIE